MSPTNERIAEYVARKQQVKDWIVDLSTLYSVGQEALNDILEKAGKAEDIQETNRILAELLREKKENNSPINYHYYRVTDGLHNYNGLVLYQFTSYPVNPNNTIVKNGIIGNFAQQTDIAQSSDNALSCEAAMRNILQESDEKDIPLDNLWAYNPWDDRIGVVHVTMASSSDEDKSRYAAIMALYVIQEEERNK